MILTRSIRRKLAIGLSLVFVMLLLLSVAGLSAIFAYWNLIDDFRYSRDQEPQQVDLLNAMIGLKEPLVRSIANMQLGFDDDVNPRFRDRFPAEQKKSESAINSHLISSNPELKVISETDERLTDEIQRTFIEPGSGPEIWKQEIDRRATRLRLPFDEQLWKERLKKAHAELAEFHRRCANHQSSESQRLRNESFLHRISDRLAFLDGLTANADAIDPQILLRTINWNIDELELSVSRMPPIPSIRRTALESALRGSDNEIQWRLWLIASPTVIVVISFLSLTYFAYHWILIPIRQLHEAAARVANGDFTYRLKLRGKDEMVELGEMFNKMTMRFQTDKAKLAQEVEERSRQILRNERLAGIGFFASGISHEINNPLQAIGAAAESLTSRLKDGSLGSQLPRDDRDLLSTYLGMIEREASRCQQITSRVLDFARGTNGPISRQDLTKIVAEVLDMVSHMSKFDGCQIVFDRSIPHMIDVSAAEMKQVVLNLVANGLESMNGTGTLNIQIVEMVDEVVLTVQDEGCGMTATVLANLYEPFFTEKQNGKGTGLGLSITHRIVGDHGGRIEATSDGPGCGSTFRVHLPRCAQAAKHAAA